jgi:hypothetical protein
MPNKIAGVVTEIVSALEALENGDERQRAVQAALTVFGDATTFTNYASPTGKVAQTTANTDPLPEGVHTSGVAWIKRNDLSAQEIEQLFHIDDSGINLLSAVGEGKRQQTINTYLLTGVGALLKSGKAEFVDETARRNCETLGCYDVNNHGKTLEKFGNTVTGSKKAGWKLTVPGLTSAAALLKSSSGKERK